MSFITFPICFKCRMAMEWLNLSSSATSPVVVRGSASVITLNCWLSPSDGWLLCFSSSRLLPPLKNFLNHHYTERSLAVPGPNVLLMLRVISTALRPILNANKNNHSYLFFV